MVVARLAVLAHRRLPARHPRSPGMIAGVLPLLRQGVPVVRTQALPIKVLRIRDPARVSPNAQVNLVVMVRWVGVQVLPQARVPDLSRLQPALSLLLTLSRL